MAAIDQDFLSIRFEIDSSTIFKIREGHDLEIVYQDTATFSAWASVNGGKEFSLHPKRKARLKVVSRMPALDASSMYVMQRRLSAGWRDVVADFPMFPQRLMPHWTYKERLGHGLPHLAALHYQGRELDLRGDYKTHREDVVVIQHGKIKVDHCGPSNSPEG